MRVVTLYTNYVVERPTYMYLEVHVQHVVEEVTEASELEERQGDGSAKSVYSGIARLILSITQPEISCDTRDVVEKPTCRTFFQPPAKNHLKNRQHRPSRLCPPWGLPGWPTPPTSSRPPPLGLVRTSWGVSTSRASRAPLEKKLAVAKAIQRLLRRETGSDPTDVEVSQLRSVGRGFIAKIKEELWVCGSVLRPDETVQERATGGRRRR
jgi:hypothetical protein